MMRNRFTSLVPGLALLLLMAAAPAMADSMAFSSLVPCTGIPATAACQPGNQNWGGNLGLAFTVNPPGGIDVTQVGVFDAAGDGLVGSITVGIYNFLTGILVPGTKYTFGPGTSQPLVNGYRMYSLPQSVMLAGGVEYQVVAVGFSSSDPNGNQRLYSGYIPPVVASGISYQGGYYDGNTSLDKPSIGPYLEGSPGSVFEAGTFAFTPEPTSIVLLFTVAGCVALILRRRLSA